MIRNLFSKLAFCIFLIMGFSCSFAAADEVDVSVPITYGYSAHSTQANYPTQVDSNTTYVANNVNNFGSSNYILGTTSEISLPYTPYYIYDNNTYYASLPGNIGGTKCGEVYNPSYVTDFQIVFDSLSISLDLSGQLNGYYRYEGYVLLGMAYSGSNIYYSQKTYDFQPSYTYSSVPLFIGDSASGMHCTVYLVGDVSYDYTVYQASKVRNHFVKFYVESTFYYDSTYSSIVNFDLTSMFGTMISNLGADFTTLRAMGGSNTYGYIFYNNRFCSKVFGNVEPPVTPTPSPTPYPGQDTQESINAGVSQIESQVSQLTNILDVHATPVPVPEELTIDETVIDVLETMTLPDIEDSRSTMSTMWEIFTPAVWYLALLAAAIFAVSIFLWILRGGWL